MHTKEPAVERMLLGRLPCAVGRVQFRHAGGLWAKHILHAFCRFTPEIVLLSEERRDRDGAPGFLAGRHVLLPRPQIAFLRSSEILVDRHAEVVALFLKS